MPGAVLTATARPMIDHRGPDFAALLHGLVPSLQGILGTTGPVVIYPSSGTGAWEAALVNTLSPGDTVLTFENGYFASLWREVAQRLGLDVARVDGSWRRGIDPAVVAARLAADKSHRVRAVLAVHNETSTGVASRIAEIRNAIDAAEHPALLLVDAISSLGSIDYRHDEWGVDVTIASSQKGLMLPPGIAFNALSDKALAAAETARLPRSYWDWRLILEANQAGVFPYTPATSLLFGLRESLIRLEAEGLERVFARHYRHAEATRQAVRAWGLEIVCEEEREYSGSVTAVFMPEGRDADKVREIILDRFDMSLGAGLGHVKGRVFRIGHLGDLNDLMLAGILCGVEMGLRLSGVSVDGSGVQVALSQLERDTSPAPP